MAVTCIMGRLVARDRFKWCKKMGNDENAVAPFGIREKKSVASKDFINPENCLLT